MSASERAIPDETTALLFFLQETRSSRTPLPEFEFAVVFAILAVHPTPPMNIMTNYSLEFGVVLRAVCPTVAGLGG
jgi:hypothetical protein